jgi:hypothetical protein
MARGLFITGFTIAGALAIQHRAKERLLEGKTVMNWNDADTSIFLTPYQVRAGKIRWKWVGSRIAACQPQANILV